MFEVGREVELSFDQVTYRDTWFPATILQNLGNGKFLAEYCSSDTNNKTKPLKVAVDSLHVRPRPPLLKDTRFVLLEKVDAYFDFGWWSGVITKELEDNTYVVFFKHTKKVKEFSQSELRPHMEWKDGKWLRSQSSQDVSILESGDVMHKQHTPENLGGAAVFVPLSNSGNRNDGKCPFSSLNKRNHQFEQLTTFVTEKPAHGTRPVAQKRKNLSDLCDALSQLPKKCKEGNVDEASQQDKCSRSSSKSLSGCVSPGSVGNMISFDNPLSGNRTKKQGNVSITTTRIDGLVSPTSGSKQITVQILQAENPEAMLEGKEPVAAAVGDTAADNVQNGKTQTEHQVVVGLPCAAETTGVSDLLTSRGERVLRSIAKQRMKHANDQIHQLDHSPSQKSKEDSKLSETAVVNDKRRRGRPQRTPKSLHIPIIGGARNEDAVAHDFRPEAVATGMVISSSNQQNDNNDIVGEGEIADGQTNLTYRKGSITRHALAKLQYKKAASNDSSIRLGQESWNEREGTKYMGENSTPQVDGSFNAFGNLDSNKEVGKVVTEAPNNEIDYESVSRWILESNSPAIVDGSGNTPVRKWRKLLLNHPTMRLITNQFQGTSPVSTVEQCTEEWAIMDTIAVVPEEENMSQPKNGKEVQQEEENAIQSKTGKEANPVVEKVSVNQNEQQSLLKHSVLWKTIESMEVFQRIPQNPHFEPLNSFKESSREGLAIGYMVTFSSLVEKTSNLQFNDNKSVTDDILETLEVLEKHGFDVKVIRDRITGLLTVKNKLGELVEEADKLNGQISVHSHERSMIEEVIREMSEQIRKLQEKLSVAESAKEKEDGEIDTLQVKLMETEKGIGNVKREFESIAASPLQ